MKQKRKTSDYEQKLMSKVEQPPQLIPQLHPFLKERIGYCMTKATLKVRAALDTALDKWGVVGPQYGMLQILKRGGPVNQIELGSCMHIDKATMVRLLDSLEERGYVKRITMPEDRRAKRLELTKSGLAALEKMDVASKEAEAEVLGNLTAAEKQQLHSLVKKILTIED